MEIIPMYIQFLMLLATIVIAFFAYKSASAANKSANATLKSVEQMDRNLKAQIVVEAAKDYLCYNIFDQ